MKTKYIWDILVTWMIKYLFLIHHYITLTEFRKSLYYHWFIIKNKKINSQVKRYIRQCVGTTQGDYIFPLVMPSSHHLHVFIYPIQKLYKQLHLMFLMDASLHSHDRLNCWPSVIKTSSPFPLPGNRGLGLKVPILWSHWHPMSHP